ncbi:MAG TPA: exodeoxyribonuclease VII large subunit [Chitinophagales bacterium]|nr:exodeoxyribonuclease VII large subunit [Chitinophagales bacterium]
MSEPAATGRKIFTLAEVARSIERVIRKNFTGSYWVKAEIARMNFYPKSGHCYPDLVEKKDGKVIAQMHATIWASYYAALTRKFKDATKEALRDGMTVLFLAKVEFHASHGLQLNILDIDTDFSLGQMAREKMETIERLKKEGIFDCNKKLALALLPKRIAIISVQTSKGYHDLMSILEDKQRGYKFSHLLFPALLQGDHAVQSICNQLWTIRRYANCFDAALIIRGGGGDIGLSCYDNYALAKEVALFPIPVITGIGHSTNETVVEMVANQNKITPTEVAYFLIQRFDDFSARVNEMNDTIISYAEKLLAEENNRLSGNIRHFKNNTQRLVEKNKFILQSIGKDLHREIRAFIAGRRKNLWEATYNLRYKPRQKFSSERTRLGNFVKFLYVHSRQVIRNGKGRVENMESKVKLLEPANVLKRGYSITFHNGKAVKDAGILKKGELIKTRLHHGSFKSKIESIQRDGE